MALAMEEKRKEEENVHIQMNVARGQVLYTSHNPIRIKEKTWSLFFLEFEILASYQLLRSASSQKTSGQTMIVVNTSPLMSNSGFNRACTRRYCGRTVREVKRQRCSYPNGKKKEEGGGMSFCLGVASPPCWLDLVASTPRSQSELRFQGMSQSASSSRPSLMGGTSNVGGAQC
ncbi:hypothetical protein OUZ56_013827 [Daphnia magna]|uniref:Uncharacterized protein n=1 Tax=Daphnia magna TaxID=35525 RepID=A0ABQ9Z7R8_9CRUS|nr:hypothetical protein OUZ56_013827 [Daphnia magna]